MAFENNIKNHTKGNMYRAHQKQEEKNKNSVVQTINFIRAWKR